MPSMRDIISNDSQYQCHLKQHLVGKLMAGRLLLLKEEVLAVLGLDLDPIRDDLIALYSSTSRGNPHDPSSMLRSLLLMLALGKTSINKWVALLRVDDDLAKLCGFDPARRKTPAVQTFYNFITRIAEGPRVAGAVGPTGARIKLGGLRAGQRGHYLRLLSLEKQKLRDEKPPEGRVNAAATEASALMKGDVARLNLPHRLNRWLFKLVVVGSAKRDLLGDVSKGLHVSGDGSIIASNANGSGHAQDKELEARLAIEAEAKAEAAETKADAKAIRKAAKQDKDTRPRYYADLKATFTLKKHPQEQWVFGHRMHVLTVKNGAIDLPLYVSMNTANAADGAMAAFDLADLSFALDEHLPEAHIAYFIADTGYDAVELYRMCMDHGITPVISLHPNSKKLLEEDGVTYNTEGVPLCAGSLAMRHNDYNKRTGKHSYHCPIKRPTHVGGKYAINVHLEECPFGVLCDESKMGPFVRVAAADDPRRHPPLPRTSAKFERLFDERTATERFFGRVKVDGGLGHRPYRIQEMYAVMGMLHAILIHRRAHVKHDFGDVKNDAEAYARALTALTSEPAALAVPA